MALTFQNGPQKPAVLLILKKPFTTINISALVRLAVTRAKEIQVAQSPIKVLKSVLSHGDTHALNNGQELTLVSRTSLALSLLK